MFTTYPDKKQSYKYNYKLIGAFVLSGFIFFGLFLISGAFQNNSVPGVSTGNLTQDQLFDIGTVRDVHLKFTDSAWKAMEPYGGPYGKDGVGIGWLNLANFFAPVYIKNGDTDGDGILSREEFIALGEKWFAEWDTKGDSALDLEMMDVGYGKSAGGMNLQGPDRNGIARVFGIRTPTSTADLTFDNLDFPMISVRNKGNGTLMSSQEKLKRPIKVDLNDGFRGRNLAGVSKLNFHNLIEDASFMNDALAYRLFRDGGVPASRTTYARLFLTVPDSLDRKYAGLYIIVENVDNNFAMDRFGTKKGAIFKPVSPQFFEYLGDDWNNYIRAFDPKTPLSIQETNRIIEICKFVSFASDEEFSAKLGTYFDLDNLARYLAINVFICDLDGILGPGQNTYMYLNPKTFQLSLIPWDHDQSFGQMGMRGSQEVREQLSIRHPWMGQNDFLERLFNEDQFMDLYLQYMKEFNETIFQPELIVEQINELAPILRPSVKEESEEILKKFDFKVGWNLDNEAGPDSADLVDPKPLRRYITLRHQSVEDQLSGKSSGLVAEGGGAPKGMIGYMFLSKMDADSNSLVSKGEFIKTFDSWFNNWASSDSTKMSMEELSLGLNKDFSPFGPDPTLKED